MLFLRNLFNTLIPNIIQYLRDIKIVNFRRSKVAAVADQHQLGDKTQQESQQHVGFNFCNSWKHRYINCFSLRTVNTETHSYNKSVVLTQCSPSNVTSVTNTSVLFIILIVVSVFQTDIQQYSNLQQVCVL
jgi:hypothetical protein